MRRISNNPGFSTLYRLASFLLLGLLITSACQPSPTKTCCSFLQTFPTKSPVVNTSPTSAVTLSSPFSTSEPPLSTLAPTAVLVPGATLPGEADQLPAVAPTPAPDPLRFVFPDTGPAPVSAWRPPLYPTPWAPTPYDHFYFARPIAADEVNWPLWDYRYGGTFFENVVHTGVDIPAPQGTPVLAAGSGKVIQAGYGVYRGYADPKDPYGLAVVIHHDFGYQGQALYTIYGHLDQVDVAKGQYVMVGQELGLVGQTGRVTGPHLHFEVRVGQNDYFSTRNPELWLVPPQGWGILVGRLTDSLGELIDKQEVLVKSLSSGQSWLAKSYALESVNSDSYYQENLVLGDLPAGVYEIRLPYIGINYSMDFQILPGEVNYFTFHGRDGLQVGLPPVPGADFSPLTQGNPTESP